jgi:myosin heavy subunit
LVSEYNSAVSSKNLADAKLQSAVDVLEVIQKYVGTLPNAVGNMTSELVLYSESVKSAVQQNTQAIQGLNISSDVKSQIQGIQEGISTAIASVQSSDMQASEIQLALSNDAALSSLVNEVAVSSLSSGDKNALLNAGQDATSYINLEAATSTLLTDDQRSALEAATSSVVKVMQDTLASGSLSSTDASMLSTSDATVQTIVQSLLQNSQITAEQESLLKSMQDTSTVQQEVQSLVSALSSVSTDTGTSTSDALYSITSTSTSDTSTDTAIDSDDTEVVVQLKILNERIILLETAAKASALYDAKMLKILERVTPDGDSISTTSAS